MDGKTIPIKTLPDLIRHYERQAEKIADHFQERAIWGHATWDSHELSMVKEFLNYLYALDRDEEIKQMKERSELAWQRVMKYVRAAYFEVGLHCPQPEPEEGEED